MDTIKELEDEAKHLFEGFSDSNVFLTEVQVSRRPGLKELLQSYLH